MVSAVDVPADVLIAAVEVDLKNSMKMPEWARFVKTGAGRERPPQQEGWWWTRAAAILRQVYIHGPVGVSRLRTAYGNRKDRGVRPEKTYKGGGKIIREILNQLEGLGYIKKTKKGREITAKGQSYLDKKCPGFGKKDAKEEKPREEVKPEPAKKEPEKPEPKKEESEKPKVKKEPAKPPVKGKPPGGGKPPKTKKKPKETKKPAEPKKKPEAKKNAGKKPAAKKAKEPAKKVKGAGKTK